MFGMDPVNTSIVLFAAIVAIVGIVLIVGVITNAVKEVRIAKYTGESPYVDDEKPEDSTTTSGG